MRLQIPIKRRVRPSDCRSVRASPVLFERGKSQFFQVGKSSNDMINNVTMNDDEVVASNVSQWYLFLYVFLDATMHLYKRSCPSVRRSVGPSVGPYVRPSVGHTRVEILQKPFSTKITGSTSVNASYAVYTALFQLGSKKKQRTKENYFRSNCVTCPL